MSRKIATYSLLGALFVSNILDIIITLMVKAKHDAFNELNLIYLKTGSITLMLYVKWIFVFMILCVFIYRYHKSHITIRYTYVIITLLITLLLIVVVISNYNIYNLPPEHKAVSVQMSNEELLDYGKTEGVAKIPQSNFNIANLVLFCFLSFVLFQRIEKENEKLQK